MNIFVHRRQAKIATRQKGTATLLILLVLIALLGFVGSRLLERPNQGELPDRVVLSRLQDVRDAIYIHLTEESHVYGMLTRYPDLRGEDGDYDGTAENGCAYAGYIFGTPLESFVSQGDNLRCIGKFPWKSFGFNLGSVTEGDVSGNVPWVAYSNNLIANANCVVNRTPLILNESYARPAGCPAGVGATLPMRWISIYDNLGRLSSNQIAFLIAMPGRPLGSQARSDLLPLPTLPTAANEIQPYLDSLSINGANPNAQPGTVNNSNQLVISQPMRFIAGTPRHKGGDSEITYDQDMAFNDRILAISAEQFYAYTEKKAQRIIAEALKKYKATQGHYPWAGQLGGVLGGSATLSGVTGNYWGKVPYVDLVNFLNLTGDQPLAKHLDQLADAGWFDYFFYAVGSGCAPPPNVGCAGGITLAGSTSAVNAILIGPGPAIKNPSPLSKGSAQIRITLPNLLSADWRDYLDGDSTSTNPTTGLYPSNTQLTNAIYNDKIYTLP